jgi:DNA-directed RNA polymerase subunit H (RpoH/RPB5)
MKRYWVIAPYSSKNEEGFDESWSFDLKKEVIAIGWSKLGDVTKLSDAELMKKIEKEYPDNHGQRIFNTLKIFYSEIKAGDIVVARKGRKTIVGIGEVSGPAFYDQAMGQERYSGEGDSFACPNFISIKWQDRYIDFDEMVFGMQTIQQISARKYESLISGNYEKDDGEEDYEEGQEYEIPLAERKIITQPSEPTIVSLVDRIDKGKLEVRSFFQRKYVWESQPVIKSRLIESVILNVPIPIIYTAEDEQTGKELVIDGQQRLLTFHGFKNNQFKLTGLTILKELNGYKFSDLSKISDPVIKELSARLGDLQDNFCDRPIRVVKILKESHPDIKFEIFERLNRGSVKLNDQELRNCIYRGTFNELLKEVVENKDFLRLQGLKNTHSRMLDTERVLRFFAFCDKGERNYKSPLKKFLNDYMLQKQNIPEAEATEKRELFKKCVELCQSVFGNVAYKRVFPGNDEMTSGYIDRNLNQGIFDVQMCGFMEYNKRDVIPRAEAIKEAFLELVTSNSKFIETIEIGTYGTPQVKLRMEMWVQKLRDVMGLPKEDRRLFTFEEKKRLFDQNNACALCGNEIAYIEDAHVDHIERYSEGGKTALSNARLTHRFCNLNRH